MCYYQPYSSSPVQCLDVVPGSTGTTTAFNNYLFGNGINFKITHEPTGTPRDVLSSSQQESVTYNFTY